MNIILQLFSIALLFGLLHLSLRNKNSLKKTSHINDIIEKLEYRFRNKQPCLTSNSDGVDWVAVINFQRAHLLKTTLMTLKQHEPNIKILVIDNGSDQQTTTALHQLFQEKKIDKLILNHHADIQQWQKSFSMHQAVNLLRSESVNSISFIDNDIEVTQPWLKAANKILRNNSDIAIVNLMRNTHEDKIHPPIASLNQHPEAVIKQSFNGAFFLVKLEFFKEYGLPPINEGISNASVEDWFYSRMIKQDNKVSACLNCANIIDTPSIRKQKG